MGVGCGGLEVKGEIEVENVDLQVITYVGCIDDENKGNHVG